MRWIEITVTTTQEASEPIAEILMETGANGTEMVDPQAFKQVLLNNRYLDYADDGLIESYGTDVIIRAYYSVDRSPTVLVQEINARITYLSAFMAVKPGTVTWQERDDAEWKDNWKQYFKTFQFTEKLMIKPSWENYEPLHGEIVIELDPGMAFGTGTHESTKMCALLGEKYLLHGDKVLDLGCGTAILALSAAKLGAGSVLAVDIDDAAVHAARENVSQNHENEKIQVRQGILSDIAKEPFELIYINIIADVILSLTEIIRDYTGGNTRIVLSGIIKSRRNEVVAGYEAIGFRAVDELSMGEWVAMVLHA